MTNKNKDIELFPVQETSPVKNGDGEVFTLNPYEDLITIAHRRIGMVSQLIELSLKSTSSRDWVLQEGAPYLIHSGAEKVARLFGVKLSNIDTKKTWSEDTKGRYYIYSTTGTASLPGGIDSIEALGTCSQRDKFFGKSGGEWKDTSDIDETNVMKASYTNFVVNAITHLLGLRNITMDMLEKAGIKAGELQSVKYGRSSEKAGATPDEKKKQSELGKSLLRYTGGDEAAARALLLEMTSFKGRDGKEVTGKDSAKALTGKWLDVTLGKVRELLKGKDDEATQSDEKGDSKKSPASKKTASTTESPWDEEDREPGQEG